MSRITKIPNDERNLQLMAAIESLPGVPATTGFQRLNGTIDFPLGPPPLSDYSDATGTYMEDDTPSRGTRIPSGTWSAPASFERLPWWARLAIESGGEPQTSAAPAYTYIQEPPLSVDDIDSATFMNGVLGNGFQVGGFRIGEFNLAIDVDNANGFWELSGNANAATVDQLAGSFEGVATAGTTTTITMTGAAWTVDEWEGAFVFLDYGTGNGPVRQIVSNSADALTVSTAFETAPSTGAKFRIAGQFPAGVTTIKEEKIPAAGTKLWILPANGTPTDLNNIRKRIISANFNLALNLDPKPFLENEAGTTSGIYGRGALKITGSIRMEFDRYDEIKQMKALDELLIRVEKEGSELEPGVRKMARVEALRAVWNDHTRDSRNNNLTQTLSFRSYLETPPIRFTTRNGLVTLDAA